MIKINFVQISQLECDIFSLKRLMKLFIQKRVNKLYGPFIKIYINFFN